MSDYTGEQILGALLDECSSTHNVGEWFDLIVKCSKEANHEDIIHVCNKTPNGVICYYTWVDKDER